MSAAGRRHMGRIAQLSCALCGTTPVEVHHIREGEAAGGAQRANDWLTVPLCPDCHRGPRGVHGDKIILKVWKKTEHHLLAETLERLYGHL